MAGSIGIVRGQSSEERRSFHPGGLGADPSLNNAIRRTRPVNHCWCIPNPFRSSAFVSPMRYNCIMSALIDAAARLTELAAEQEGLVTTAQAASVDVTRLELSRLVDKLLLERVTHGVYAFRVSSDINQLIRAEWLALEPGMTARERRRRSDKGVISHTSATIVHDLGDFVEGPPEFTLPGRRQSRRDIRIHRGELTRADVTSVDSVLVTTAARTVADLVSDGHDLEHISRVVREALHEGNATVEGVAAQLEPLAHDHGRANGFAFTTFLMKVAGMTPTPPLAPVGSRAHG